MNVTLATADARVKRFVREFARPAWRLAYALVGNAADAEDVVQEAFVVATRKPHAIPSDGDGWPWIAAVVTNAARNLRRVRGRWTRRTSGSFEVARAIAGERRAANPDDAPVADAELEPDLSAGLGEPLAGR